MQRDYLPLGASKIHYLRFGSGDKLLIALHGFGDRANLFLALTEALAETYTVYAFDLPYHGHTKWAETQYSAAQMQELIEIIITREQKSRFELMGYSFGGRIVQRILPSLIDRVDKIYLIAPDGIKTRWMFNLSMLPRWFRYLLRRSLHKPKGFIKMIGWLHRRGLMSKFVHDFTHNHIYTPERRDRIFCTWLSLDDFKISLKKVKQVLREHPIPVATYFGSRDEVIPVSAGKLLQEGMPNIELHVLEEGHLLVDQALCELLKKQLLEEE